MRNKTLTQFVAILAALLSVSAQAQFWSRSEPRHSPPAKAQVLQLQDPPAAPAIKEQEPSRALQTLPQEEPRIIKETRSYEQTLRDLAQRAEQIVQRMPDKPDELARNFGELREVLLSARTNLTAILQGKPQIEAQAQAVLQSAADLRQQFSDLVNKIEDRLQQLRQKETDNPRAVEAAANALEGIKATCQRGQTAVGPLRQLVLETHRQGQAIFAELELYPQIFDYAIETMRFIPEGHRRASQLRRCGGRLNQGSCQLALDHPELYASRPKGRGGHQENPAHDQSCTAHLIGPKSWKLPPMKPKTSDARGWL